MGCLCSTRFCERLQWDYDVEKQHRHQGKRTTNSLPNIELPYISPRKRPFSKMSTISYTMPIPVEFKPVSARNLPSVRQYSPVAYVRNIKVTETANIDESVSEGGDSLESGEISESEWDNESEMYMDSPVLNSIVSNLSTFGSIDNKSNIGYHNNETPMELRSIESFDIYSIENHIPSRDISASRIYISNNSQEAFLVDDHSNSGFYDDKTSVELRSILSLDVNSLKNYNTSTLISANPRIINKESDNISGPDSLESSSPFEDNLHHSLTTFNEEARSYYSLNTVINSMQFVRSALKNGDTNDSDIPSLQSTSLNYLPETKTNGNSDQSTMGEYNNINDQSVDEDYRNSNMENVIRKHSNTSNGLSPTGREKTRSRIPISIQGHRSSVNKGNPNKRTYNPFIDSEFVKQNRIANRPRFDIHF